MVAASMPPKRTRRRHKNSHLGCQTCKKRKIKCDERLTPCCRNCEKMGLTCSYSLLSETELNDLILTQQKKQKEIQDDISTTATTTTSTTTPTPRFSPLPPLPTLSQRMPSVSSLSDPSFDEFLDPIIHNIQLDSDFLLKSEVEVAPLFPREPYSYSSKINKSSRKVNKKLPVYSAEITYTKQIVDLLVVVKQFCFLKESANTIFSDHLQGHMTGLLFKKILPLSPFSSNTRYALLNSVVNYLKAVLPVQKYWNVDNLSSVVKFLETYQIGVFDKVLLKSKNLISKYKLLSYAQIENLICSQSFINGALYYEDFDFNKFMLTTSGSYAVALGGTNATHLKNVADDTVHTVSSLASFLIHSFKTLYFPDYNPEFLNEVLQKLLMFAELNHLNENEFEDEYSIDKGSDRYRHFLKFKLLKDFLMEYSNRLIYYQKLEGCLKYSPQFTLQLSKKFYVILPPDLNNQMYISDLDYTLNLFYIAVGEGLWAIIPECAFLGTADFLGGLRYGHQEFAKADMLRKSYNLHLDFKQFNTYLIRIFTFFSKRRRLLFKYLMLTDPFNGIKVEDLEKTEKGNELIENFISKSKKLKRSKEVQFKSFEKYYISFSSYPHKETLNLDDSPTSSTTSTTTPTSASEKHRTESLSLGQSFQAPIMMPDFLDQDLENLLDFESVDFTISKVDVNQPFRDLIRENTLFTNGLFVGDFDPDQHVDPDVEMASLKNQALLSSVSVDVTALCFLLRKKVIEHG